MATNIARGHDGDSGGEPPQRPNRIPTVCESSKPRRTRAHGRNLNLYEEFEKNSSRPLPLEFNETGTHFKFVGDNYRMFMRLISNEVVRNAPFHCRSLDVVPAKYKRLIYPTLHHYFDLDSFRGMPHCNGVVLAIEADRASSYKNRK